jgi:hypothetical protein
VGVEGIASDAVRVVDRGDGSYAVDLCIPTPGTYTLTSALGGTHLRGSPMAITVYRHGIAG